MEPKGIQAKISAYIEKHPELRLSTREIVLFEMQKAGEISAADIEKVKKGSLFGISDDGNVNLNSYVTIDACKNKDIVYTENIIENICGIPQKEANKARLGEAVVNILSSNNIELSEENIINVLSALNIIQVNEGPLQPPSDKDARAVAAQYMLEEINQIIAAYESIAHSDTSMWTIGTGLIVSVNDAYEAIAKKVNDLVGAPLLSEGGNSRQELGPKLYKLRQQCNALAKITENEANDKNSNNNIYAQTFNESYKKIFGTNFKSDTVVNYLKALQEYQQASKEERDDVQSDVHKNFINAQQEFEKTNPLNSLSKDIEGYAKSMGNIGGLADLGLNIALMYLSGGGAAIAKSAQTARSLARYSVGSALKGVKISNNAKFIAQEAASILSSTAVNSIETSAFFNATKVLAIVEDGKIQADEVALVGESFKGLCDFTAVGGLLAGPLGIKISELTSKLFNSERAIASTIKIAVEGKGTTLDKVLKALSENSNAISKITEFGISFSTNAGYMAVSDGMSFDEAMKSLAQMDAVSKLVIAMLGGKNVSFLTPQKVQQIKTDLAGYQVKMTVFKGKKVYEVTDKTGAKTQLGNEQELFKFIISREVSVIEQDINIEKTAEKVKPAETKPAETKPTTGKKTKISAAEAKEQRAERIAKLDAATVESNIGKHIDEKIFKLDKTDTNAVDEIRKEIRALKKTQPEEAKNLEVLLNAVTQNKQCSEATTEEIAAVVNHLRRQYSAEEAEMIQLLESFGVKDLGHFSSRIKGDMSMFDKIANFAKKNPDKPFSKAIDDVRDAFGARVVLDSVDMTNVPEVKALLKAGNIEDAAKVASFMNSAKIMDFITKIINSKDGSTITRISNYADGKELSVLSSAQMFTLAELAKGKDLVVEGLKDGSKDYKSHQKSGYPALQINIKTKTGRILELQMRYDTVDEYAEAEHLVYDSTTDKDIIGRHEETAPILNDFKEALGDINKEEYNKYSKAQYHHRFLKAFGIETPEPKLEDFAPEGKPFDNRLSAKNLLKLHDDVEKVKKGSVNKKEKYVTPTTKELEVVLSDNIMSSETMERADIGDIEELTTLAKICGLSKNYELRNVIESFEYKYQKPLLKELLKFTYEDYFGNNKHIDSYTINTILPKLKGTNDIDRILKLYQKYSDIRYDMDSFIREFGSESFPLLQIIFESTTLAINEINTIKQIFNTPEKIQKAIDEYENIPLEYRKSADFTIKELNRIVNNVNSTDIEARENKIDSIYGKGTTHKYLNTDILMMMDNPVKENAVQKLLKYKDEKYFYYDNMQRYDISCLIVDALPYIKTEADIEIIIKIIDYQLSTKPNGIYVSDVNFRFTTLKDIFEQLDSKKDYITYIINALHGIEEQSSILYAIEQAKNVNNHDVVIEMKKYFDNAPFSKNYHVGIYAKEFIDLSNNQYRLEAIKLINKYNEMHKDNEYMKYNIVGYEPLNIENIKDQSSLDYFKFILDKSRQNNKYSINHLLNIAKTEYERNAVKILLSSKIEDYSVYDIDGLLAQIKTENDVQRLSNIISKKLFGIFERKLTLDDVVNKLQVNTNNKKYASIIKQRFPNADVNEVIRFIKDDADVNLALKFLEKNRPYQLSFISEYKDNSDVTKALEYMLDNNPTLIDMVKNAGILSMTNVYEKVKSLHEAGEILPMNNLIANQFFTDNYINDTKRKNSNFKISKYSQLTSAEEILNNTQIGDVCNINGTLHIRENNKLVKLNISEETYLKLFPLQSKFATEQGDLGDCWLISTIDVLISSPIGRSKLFQLFSEKDGTVYITLPGHEAIPFENGKPISKDNGIFTKHANACDGVRLLEEAAAIVRADKKVSDIRSLTDLDKIMDNIVGGSDDMGFELLLGTVGELPSISNPELFEEVLLKNGNDTNTVIRTGINRSVKIPQNISLQYNLCNGHAYRIEGYNITDKMVYIVNPHNTRIRIEIPLDTFKTYFSSMHILNF